MTTIKLKNGSGAPTSGDLVQGEPALDLTNKRLYTENASGTVIEVGTNPTSVTTGDITATGTASFANLATTGNITFGDNDKAIFGAGSDLQIYHDGSNSYIKDAGTGDLIVEGSNNIWLMKAGGSEVFLNTADDGAVQLYYDNAVKLATTSTGVDVTGTVTVDGLTVNGNATIQQDDALVFIKETDGTNIAAVGDLTGAGQGGAFYYDHGGTATIQLKSYEASTIENGLNVKGDISFYESTGTTPKFFWDASAESLGIGTSSPGTKLSVVDTSAQAVQLSLQNSGRDWRIGPNSGVGSSSLVFYDNTASQTRLVIDSSGNVGIGTSSPARKLHVVGTSRPALIGSDNAVNYLKLYNSATGSSTYNGLDLLVNSTSDSQINTYGMPLTFGTSASNGTNVTERMRLDTSGNFMVGKTSASFTTAGLELRNGGPAIFGRDQAEPLILNRLTTDGGIVNFNKDGTTVGSIGVNGDRIYLAGANEAVGIDDSWNAFVPLATGGGNSDADTDLGNPSSKFKDLYLSGNAYADNFIGADDGDTFIAMTGSNVMRFFTGNSEGARLDASGNLLVGTTNTLPAINNVAGIALSAGSFGGRLEVSRDGAEAVSINRKTDDGSLMSFKKDGTTVGSINANGGAFVFKGANASAPVQLQTHDGNEDIEVDPDGFIKMETAGVERLRIDASGNLLVGTTDTNVFDNSSGSGINLRASGEVQIAVDSGETLYLNRMGTDGRVINFRKAGAFVAGIDVTSTTVTYNTSSDQRLKDNIVDAPSASDDIDAIQVRSFDWKADGSHQKYGMVAQELQSVAPEAVSEGETEEDMMGVDYSKLVPMLVKEIQSLRARVAQLEGEN